MSVTTTTPPVAPPRDGRPGDRAEWALAGALLLVAPAAGLVIASSPTLGVLAGAGLLLIAATAVWPAHAVIGYVAVTPLIVGLDRGAVVPGLRLNEVLLAPLVAGVALAGLYRWYRTGWRRPRGVHRLDAVVLLLAVTGSVTTLLWMYARGREITGEDVQYALALWKLAVLYAVVRMFVREPRAVRATLLVTVASAAFVGALGMLQTVGVGPVLDLLGRFVSPGEEGFDAAGSRATSTIGNPHAFGDVLVYAAVVAGALAVTGRRNRWPIAAVAAALAAGSLASGSFSTAIALATAGIAFAVVTGTARWLVAAGIALAPLAYLGLQPVVKSRVSDLDPNTGLPASWTDRYGRLDNLRTYFWPRLGEDFNWLLGVRPTSRVPGVVEPWVYIESGYTWALWNGG
ncbi:MAG: hypothetical protein JF630_13850, partial [Geodermatophilales bacterium]|nr:hypothetical protein [Geodermatophilales bacterium]